MTFEWSDTTVTRPYGEYGIAYNGSSLHLVTFSGKSGAFSVIGNFMNPAHFPIEYFESVVASLEARAVAIAAKHYAQHYAPEALAYVRSRPEGSRSPYMDLDQEEVVQTLEDVQTAVSQALVERDAYRAAKLFETHVPHLVGDVELVEMLGGMLDDFHNVQLAPAKQFEKFVCVAAARTESERSLRSQFLRDAIKKLRDTSGHASVGMR